MEPFDYNKYLQNNPLLKEEKMEEGPGIFRKMKDFAGEKGWTFSARRPTEEEEQIARDYMRSQGKELGSIGVDKITGNINVMEPNGDFRAILAPDGEELSAWEINIHEGDLKEAQLDPVNQQLKDKYIQDYLTQTVDDNAGEYNHDLTDMDTIEAHAQKFGYTDTLRTIDAKNDPKFSDRGIPHGGFDPLQGKVPGNYMRGLSTYRRDPVITKKGKMHKSDVDLLKRKIKSDLGLNYEKYIRNNPLLKESINEATVRDLIKPLRSKLESMGYEVDVDPSFGFPMIEARKTLPDGSVLQMYVEPSEEEIQNRIGRPVAGETIDVEFNHWTREVVKRFFGLLKTKGDWDLKRLPDEAGRNIDLGTGMFDIPVEQSVDRVISLVKKAEAKVSPMQTRPMDLDTQGE